MNPFLLDSCFTLSKPCYSQHRNQNLNCSSTANGSLAEVQLTLLLAFSDGAGFAGVEANYYRRTPVCGLSPELRTDSTIAALRFCSI